MSDDALAVAAATGDPVAFEAFFERFHGLVARYITRVHGDDIEDLVQLTFLQLAEGKARFEGRAKVGTWLLGIATNIVRRHRRSSARKRSLERSYQDAQGAAAHGPSPERDADARDALRRVGQQLAQQPEGHRMAFVLCEIEGLSAREAGAILSISETAVWKRVSDTRKKLKSALEGTP